MSHFDVDGGGDNEMNINTIHDIRAVYIQQSEDIVLKNEVANDALYNEDDQTNTMEEDDNIFVNSEVANDAVDYDAAVTNAISKYDNIFVNSEVANDAVDYDAALTNTLEEDDNIFVNNELKSDLTDTIEDDNNFVYSEVKSDLTNTIEDDKIFVYNEVANDAIDSEYDDETNSIQQNDLSWLPIVYTTRLDEMHIFDKIEKYTPKEAAVLIQYESKPQYKQILPIKREPCGFHSYSFMKLYSDIERFNQKVQIETRQRNEELLSMCKPLKIVLKDIDCDKVKTTDPGSKNFNQTNRKPHSTPKIEKKLVKPKMAEKEIVMSVAKFQKRMSIKIHDSDSDSSDDMPLTMLKPCDINLTQILPGTTTLAFIDKTSMKADVYIINYSKDLRCSYEYNSEQYNLLKKTYPTKNTIAYDVCCWVKRENQIKLLSQNNVANENVISFMRIPHGCLPASCTCCCILEHPMPMQSSVAFVKMTNKKSKINTEASKLIGKAYSYRTKSQSSKTYAVDPVDPTNFLNNAVIMIKYRSIVFSQSYDLGENYEIGMEGNVDNHVKLTVNRSITEEKELLEKNDKNNNICRQYFSYLICCWFKREEIIDNMSKTHNLSPRACKYLRNPHLCKSHKCQCCCKRAKIGLFFDEKNISTQPQSKKQSKVIRTVIKEDKKKNQVTIDQSEASKIKKVYIDNKKNKKLVASGNVANKIKNKNKQTEQTISQSIVEPSIESQPHVNVAKTVEPPTAPAELITSIFDKFRDLQLSVNANGTLTANINTPPEKLSTAEIKNLADILAQASNQMHEMGIEPEEFCRRVNLKPLIMNASGNQITEIQNIPIPPKLPIITQPSSILPQKLISPPPLCPIVKKTIENTKDIIKPPQYKRVKQKSHPCKTNQFSVCFPRTTNSSRAANLYSMMSHTGWIRNKCMISSYKIHFNIDTNFEPEPQLRKIQVSNVEEQTLPKIVNVQSLVDTAPKTKNESNSDKSKKKQADKPKSTGETCKIRVLPPERISTLPTNTQPKMTGSANLAVLTKKFVKPMEPIPGHSQENRFDRNSGLTPIQNVNSDLASPLQNAGNNIVLAQGINSIAPTMQIPDTGKIWAYIEGKLVELQLAQKALPNATSQNNIAFNQNYGTPNTGTVNQTPMITVNNGVPMQGSRVCAGTPHIDDVTPPAVNEETQECAMNSLLRDMLSKESALPNLPQPRKHRYANSRKRAVTPLILAHSKELELNKKKRRKKRDLDDPIVSPASKENLQNSDKDITIQIIVSDDEEESIFGV